jgi:acyl-CoA synthetase (AMP-forming)/AMP-acid ligase II
LTTALDRVSAADILAGLPNRLSKVIAPHIADGAGRLAFVEAGRTWSYRQFGTAVAAVAADLARLQIRPGDRVLLASENSVAVASLIFACSELDAWPVVVNPRLSAREFDQIYTHSGAGRILIATEISKEAAAHAARLDAELHQIGPFGGIGVSALNQSSKPEPVDEDPARQVATLMYTSGTTGQPKGVMLSHRAVLFTASVSILLRGIAPDDRVYAVLPMSHIVGFTILLVATLMAGATAHVVPKYAPAALAKAIAEDGITELSGVPTTYQRLLGFKALNGLARLERGRLRRMLVAGAPLDLNLKARVEEEFGQPLFNNYGITECSPRHSDCKGRTTTGLALDGDVAAHHLTEAAADSEAKTRSTVFARRHGGSLGKLLKQLAHLLCRHPDAGIGHCQCDPVAAVLLPLRSIDRDGATVGELVGIAHEVQQRLA